MSPIARSPNESNIPVWGLVLMIVAPVAVGVLVFVFLKIRNAIRFADLWLFAWFKRRGK